MPPEMHQQDVVYKTFQATTAQGQVRIAETHPEQDNYFYRSKLGTEKDIVLTPGDFVILFPWDIHAPLCHVEHEAPCVKWWLRFLCVCCTQVYDPGLTPLRTVIRRPTLLCYSAWYAAVICYVLPGKMESKRR